MTRIQSRVDEKSKLLTVEVIGTFDFDSVYEFRAAYEKVTDKPTAVDIDLRQTQAIDSAALGMLLNMKRTLGLAENKVRILNAQAEVRRILEIARFDKKFTIV